MSAGRSIVALRLGCGKEEGTKFLVGVLRRQLVSSIPKRYIGYIVQLLTEILSKPSASSGRVGLRIGRTWIQYKHERLGIKTIAKLTSRSDFPK